MIRVLTAFILAAGACFAGDWLTFGSDPQRTGLAVGEDVLNAQTVSKLKLEWKIKLDVPIKELHTLTTPVVVNPIVTTKGFVEVAVVAGADDSLYAINTDLAKIFWQKKFTTNGTPKQVPNWLCPNALTATPVIDKATRTVYVITSDGFLHALNLMNGEDKFPPKQFTPPFAKPYSLNLVNGVLTVPIGQGCNGNKNGIFTMDLNDPERPVREFRTTTTGGAGIWGRAGAAIGNDGRSYVETGDGAFDPEAGKWADSFLSFHPKALVMADYYTPANRAWITKKDLDQGNFTPAIFPFKGRELLAGGGKEGVLFLLDTKSMGGADHREPLYRSELLINEEADFAGTGFWGSAATYEDKAGVRWLYLPAWGPLASTAPKFPLSYGEVREGSILAFKIVEKEGKPFPEPAWISRDMHVPEPPVIANGVVFAVASGEYVRQVDEQARLMTSQYRIDHQVSNAALYAFDAKTGKELWNSGKAMTGFTHFGGLAIANGRIFVTTYDATVYAFSVPQ
ncbi:MAG: PQQ-binding-like beta-propeller repeat protein [Acidobacteriota bacterium]